MKEQNVLGHNVNGNLVKRKAQLISENKESSDITAEFLELFPESTNTAKIRQGTGTDDKGNFVVRSIENVNIQQESSLTDYIKRHLGKNSEQD